MPLKSMALEDLSQEYFTFWLAREFLAADDNTEAENMTDRLVVLVGALLFVVITLVGFITRGNV
jgi:hypothetical protein